MEKEDGAYFKVLVLKEEKFPDSLEVDFGGTGQRGKVYFNSSDKMEANQRIENYFEIAKYKDKLLEEYKEKVKE